VRFCRWSEELCLVEYEMKWTVNWFHWKENKWRQWLRDLNDDERPSRLDSYCHKHIALCRSSTGPILQSLGFVILVVLCRV